MKILKRIIIGILILLAIPLIIALFIKRDYAVEREILIEKSKSEVFEYVKYLKNQNNFSVWAKMDPNMKTKFIGTDGNVGFVSSWSSDSKDVGKGEQEIKKIVDGQRIDYEIRFIEPFASVAPAYMVFESVGELQTRVKWGFQGRMPYPFNIFKLFMNMEDMIGNDLSTGLYNLKMILENDHQ